MGRGCHRSRGLCDQHDKITQPLLPPRPYPFLVVVTPAESGLAEASAVNCAQLATIRQAGPASRLRPPRGETAPRPIGHLGPQQMAEVDRALSYSLGLEG